MALWYIIPPLILALGLYYVGRRLFRPLALTASQRRWAWLAMVVWGLVMIGALVLSRLEIPFASLLSWVGYVSLGVLSTLFFLLLARDILLVLGRGTAWAVRAVARRPTLEATVDTSRRDHLAQWSNVAVLGIAASVTGYGIYEARRRPGIVQLTVPIGDLPDPFVGFRIVQITDVHAGLTVGRDWIETVVAETAALDGDLIAFTGDMVDGSVASLRDVVAPFAELRAPHGSYFITGNHEYYSGADEWVRQVERMGYDPLMNEHRIIERDGARIVLGGVTDYSAGRELPAHTSDPKRAFSGAPDGLRRILLAHQPKSLRHTGDVPFDLMISGHTHGGQFFPWNLATASDQPYLYGLHRPNGRWIYVSKGTGYWGPPVRLGARSEITVITLGRG